MRSMLPVFSFVEAVRRLYLVAIVIVCLYNLGIIPNFYSNTLFFLLYLFHLIISSDTSNMLLSLL